MSDARTVLILAMTLAIVGTAAGLFLADFEANDPDPVDFDDTVTVGLALDDELQLDAETRNVALPRVQVFYSQYPYVVGYYGVEQFAAARERPGHDRQFGFPLTVYVTVYDGTGIQLSEDGYPRTAGEPGWHPAEESHYVIGSEAATPGGDTVLAFVDHRRATAFADEHGGRVLTWEEALAETPAVDDAETVQNRVADQQTDADRLVAESATRLDRPTSVVVGEDKPTVQAAIDAAPAGTTVVVPEGTYQETLEIDTAITVRGAGEASIVGDQSGSVIEITAAEVAITGLDISGVGMATPGAGATGGHSHDHGTTDEGDDENETESTGSGWDREIEDDYGTGDAGIVTRDAPGVRIENVTIETPASGIMLKDSPESVVTDVTVNGNPSHVDAHMGLVAMRSPGVVQDSTFLRGLDGVYTHRADGIVIRENTMVDNRMGVHMMHTSGALLADNIVSNQLDTGIFVMTGPERNGLLRNEIRNSPTGIDVGGTDSYVAGNRLIGNGLGLQLDTGSSIVERNLLLDNDDGLATRALLPTNRVVENDFIGNGDHVASSSGAVRIWTHDDRGNYWEGAVGMTDGETLDRAYSPTAAVDRELHRTAGTPTLAQSPALGALASFEAAVAGMREGEILDTAPLCEPVNQDWLETRGRTDHEPTC